MRTAIIGCGNISDIYLKNLVSAKNVRVVAVADKIAERADEKAKQYHLESMSVDQLLNDTSIELVVNLTIPAAHAEISARALTAGKHVYGEKPLALTTSEGQQLLELSRVHKRRIGSAPDTVLGTGIQTARKLIDDGWIGDPVAATAFVVGHGHESWHPDPDFYYQPGGGPLFDMGPYYLTALFQLMGPVRRVTSIAAQTFAERVIQSEPRRGERIIVRTPTHVAGNLEFDNGAVATLITSFDVWHAELPQIEIYGSEGTLSVPDPNGFSGPVRMRRYDGTEWVPMPWLSGPTGRARGCGVVDLVDAIREERMARTDGRIAFHVLEVMESLLSSSVEGQHREIASRPERPLAMPMHDNTLPQRGRFGA